MMNLLGLCLVVSSLIASGVWSPSPDDHQKQQNQKEDVIVKKVHRTIVVEYDQNGQTNTKVSISPSTQHQQDQGMFDNNKEMMKQSPSALPNIGQGLSQPKTNGGHQRHIHASTPGELICDAVGKCTHKIASEIRKGKYHFQEAAHDVINFKKEASHEVFDETKEIAREAKEDVVDAYGNAKKSVGQKAHEIKETTEESFDKAKENVAQKAHDVKEGTRESWEKAKGTAKTAKDTGKTIRGDIVRNVSEEVVEYAKRVKSVAHWLRSMASAEALNSLMGVLNLMGFTTAYGTCVWVTFVSSYVLGGVLPRQQFGVVQSKIYPVYFRAMGSSIFMALLGHLFLQGKKLFSSKAEMFHGCNLLASLLIVFANAVFLEPRATKVMFERMKVEKEEGRGTESFVPKSSRGAEMPQPVTETTTSRTEAEAPQSVPEGQPERAEEEAVRSRIVRLSKRLKMLNSVSSFLNILSLMGLTWYLVYLSQRLHGIC